MAKYGDKTSGLKSLFGKKNANGQASSKFVASASLDSLGDQIESADYIRAELENKERVVPTVDFSAPAKFAKYGSAKEYYKTSIERIYKTYPYDGSKKEKIQWSLSSSYLDNYIFENEYPRTNGFVSFTPLNGGSAASFVNNPGTGDEAYQLATSAQYVSVKGGPNQASLPLYDQNLEKSADFKNPEHKANFYDTTNNREKNITIDGATGNTIEFWLRTDGNVFTTKALFDAWNNDGTAETQPGSASYGRLLLESRFETTSNNFVNGCLMHLTFQSGTTGAERVPLFPISIIGAPTVGDFDHYAVTIKNSGNQLSVKTFYNGNLIENKLTGSSVLEVTGASAGGIDAHLGGYRTYPNEYVKAAGITAGLSTFSGGGNASASFDEFRFWKTARTENEINSYWFTQVGAGTNTDTSNTKLGIYFKFNEGITGDSTSDQNVLDYSGRVSNGLYNNYSATVRSTGSAMVLAGAAEREFKDPILYFSHPTVSSYKDASIQKGKEWDYRNPSMLFNTLPAWIQEEDSNGNRNTTLELTQIMASYFDTLHLQIEEMKKIKTVRYLSSSIESHTKPSPFASKLLTNYGFVAPEIFADTDVIAALAHKDDEREYEKKLYDVKNYIYQNIYNNLTYINKSKGTQKAIRNLFRCFGVDEEIYKINLYADNSEYTLSNNFVEKSIRKTYADFNNVERNDASVYSYKNSSEANNFGFITGSTNTSSGFDRGLAMTVEAEAILPRKPEHGDPNFQNKYFPFLTSSVFGMHSAKADAGSDAATVTTWDSNDYANFQVYAVADTFKEDEEASKSVQFIMKSYNGVLPTLTSSLYMDQYKDVKWNFAVRVKPKGYPYIGTTITGSLGKDYDVEFEGISTISDVVINSFKATGSITNAAGLNFITQKKRLYAGAHRTNFTGSVREFSDALVSSCRYWADDLTSDEFKAHAIDPSTYGVITPNENSYLTIPRPDGAIEVPRIKSLLLNWEFDTITGSDGSGQFIVKDSSYTINQDENYQLWGTDFENLLEGNNDARGDFFEASDKNSVSREYLSAFKQQIPENINDSNMITVAATDDLTFTKNTLPVKFSFAIEKSMYQTISEEMINFFIASKEASALENYVGDPVNRYRMGFKSMEKVRNLFFNRVGNTPDLEKYLNYYKWLDNSISEMVKQLVPASAKLPSVTNVVESHMLERNKYQSKFPTVEGKLGIIEDAARGINELAYDWKHGHAPLDNSEKDNCLWWNKRASRDNPTLTSDDAATDYDRKQIHSASLQVFNRKLDTGIRLKLDNQGLRKSLNKKQFVFAETPPGTGENIAFNTTTLSKPVTCDDTTDKNPQFKFKPQFRITSGSESGASYLGRMVSPVVFYSSSVGSQNTDPTGFFKTTQHLQDYYVDTKDVPLQGPFTEQHVGGYQYRHVGLNISAASTRQEGWYTTTTTVGGETYFVIYNPFAISTGYPRAGYSRDHIAKSSVNIKNIKNITSSQIPSVGGTTNELGSSISLGNYSHDYEIVQIPGRSINNKYFIENVGISTASVSPTFLPIRSNIDRAIPNRGKNKYVFVNKFSAPGGPETMGAGFLDYESETFSVYNALPYRNLSVRVPLRGWLTEHSAYGGYNSVLGSPNASYHKTQRNGAKRLKINGQPEAGSHDGLGLSLVTGTTFDNAFVQHMIPQSDMQYSWITASATSTIFGYQQPNNANASMASTDITFVTASQVQSFTTSGNRLFASAIPRAATFALVPTDFVGLNFHAIGDITASTNTLGLSLNSDFVNSGLVAEDLSNLAAGYVGQSAILNAINLNRNGAGGFSSWRQVRQADHPVVRDMKKTNRMSFLREESVLNDIFENNGEFVAEDKLFSYTEPPVSSKYKPLRHIVQLWNFQKDNGLEGPEIILNSSYGNNLVYFTMTNTNGIQTVFESMTKTIGFDPSHERQVYDDLKRIYIDNEYDGALLGSNPIKLVPSMKYRETVYPRESFTFLKKTRMRENYGEASGSTEFNRPLGKARTFWRDESKDRLRSIGDAKNSMNVPIDVGTFNGTSYENVIDLDCWPLTANYPMVQIAPTGAGGVIDTVTAAGQGEGSLRLPTTTELKSLNGELSYNNWVFNLYKVPMQGLGTSAPTTLTSSNSITASLSYEYGTYALSGSDVLDKTGNSYNLAHLNMIPDWTANLTSSRNPWFDSYDEYSNDIRRIGKDFTVIPEFRISDHMDYYLKKGFKAPNKKFMDVIGATTSNTSSATTENTNLLNDEFFRIYSHTDFMKHFEVLREDHVSAPAEKINSALIPSKIKLKCKGIKKLLPYQGFYPALRTVQLGQMFSSSYGPYLTGTYNGKGAVDAEQETQQLASLLQPFFAPGIMFNTVKSGIAVDWPVITGSITSKNPTPLSTGSQPAYGYRAAGMFNFDPDWRMPFEAIVEPNKHLPKFNDNFNNGGTTDPSANLYHMWNNYLDLDLAYSDLAKRFSPLDGNGDPTETSAWYDSAGYARPTPNCAWKGEFDRKYNLAMSNFLAETIDFFLEDQQVTTFVSKPEKQFKPMVSGTTYFMDVVLSKTSEFKMYEGPEACFDFTMAFTASDLSVEFDNRLRGMHYGPAFSVSRMFSESTSSQRNTEIVRATRDPAFAPYTPPYFYGSSIARVAFRPHALRAMEEGDSDTFTLSEIFSSAEIETVYLNTNDNTKGAWSSSRALTALSPSASAAYRNQMQISSSVKLFERTGEKFVDYAPIIGDNGEISYVPKAVTSPNNTENDVWVIETKFECPTLNFQSHPTASFGKSADASGEEQKMTSGMWKTFGTIPTEDEGVFMSIKDSFPQIKTRKAVVGRAGGERETSIRATGSLIDICGFDGRQKRVGELASSKTISEAIVAIPLNSDGTRVKIPKSAFNVQKQNVENDGIAVKAGDFSGVTQNIKETSISDMIKKMKKYVMPPHLDCINNDTVEPYVAYIFEFEHNLSKDDLSLIWQNMMPDISVTAQLTEATIEHPVLTGPDLEFFGTNPGVLTGKDKTDTTDISVFPPDMKWMVFKVKKRAKNNYFGLSITQDDNKGFGLSELDPQGKLGVSGKQLIYSYNWPYDFFSLVELGKMDSTITFEPRNSPAGTAEEPPLEQQIQSEEAKKQSVSTPGQQTSDVDIASIPGFGLDDPLP